jgi:putative FmdB family regulatory protein
MPLYDFRCNKCGLEFEVSRPLARASEPAYCPMDNTAAERVFTMPGTFVRQGERGGDIPKPPQQQSGAFSHFGHSHGPGAGTHSH